MRTLLIVASLEVLAAAAAVYGAGRGRKAGRPGRLRAGVLGAVAAGLAALAFLAHCYARNVKDGVALPW